MAARKERAEEIRAAEEAKAGGYEGAGEEGEEALRAAAQANSMAANRIAMERREHKAKIDIFEAAFRKIKDATGVSDVNEVIQKIVSQEGTTENLMLLTKENQAKIAHLHAAKEAARQRVDEAKYAGGGGGHRRKLVDDMEESLQSHHAKIERVRGKHERLSGMLIAVKAGVKHLAEKVAPASADLGDRKGKGANGAGAGEVTDETVVAALAEVERAVHRLLSRVKAKRAEELSLLADDDDGGDGDEALLKMSGAALLGADVDDAVLLTRPHNQRISLPTPEGG